MSDPLRGSFDRLDRLPVPPRDVERPLNRGRLIRRRRHAAIGGGFVAAVAVVVLVIPLVSRWATNEGSNPAKRPDHSKSAAARAEDIGTTIDLRGHPGEISVGPAGVWALTYVSHGPRLSTFLEHVDPVSGEVVGQPLLLSDDPLDTYLTLAVGEGDVWVTHYGAVPSSQPDRRDGTVLRVDIAKNEVVAWIPVDHNPAGLAVGEDGVWVTSEMDDTLARIDPSTNAVAFSMPVGDGPQDVVVADGSVWVTDSIGDVTVERIDPARGEVTARFKGAVLELVTDDTAFVTTNGRPNGQLRRIDVERDEYTDEFYPLRITPIDLVATGSQLWLGRWIEGEDQPTEGPLIGDYTFFRFDPEANQTKGAGVIVPNGPYSVIASDEALWVPTPRSELIRVDPESIP